MGRRKSVKDDRIVIRCNTRTRELWRKYVAHSGARDAEEALIKLLEYSGWLSKLRAFEFIEKDVV